jgi:serine/threonine-protein kinase HipA
MSLAGAQDKLPVALRNGKLAIPINGAPSTHILKPDITRLPGSVQNKALCMVLAKRCRLPVAQITTGIAGARSYLLVTRYDRAITGQSIARLHQEDFCQALGRIPADKYEHNHTRQRGPSIADMVALIREHMTARDINRFLDPVIFNIAIGNVDSHAKNYSILLSSQRPELAPLYDLMSGLAWQSITPNHAQEIGGQRNGRYIFARHWRRLAEASGLSATATLKRVSEITTRVLDELPRARADVGSLSMRPSPLLSSFAEEISVRAQLVKTNALNEARSE